MSVALVTYNRRSSAARWACAICVTASASAIDTGLMRSPPLGLDVDRDPAPFPLVESQDAEGATRDVSNKNRDPDIDGIERTRPLNDEADPEWNDDLRHDRDVQRALGVSRALQPTGVRERDRDEQPRHAQHMEELNADGKNGGVVHAEDREEPLRHEQE